MKLDNFETFNLNESMGGLLQSTFADLKEITLGLGKSAKVKEEVLKELHKKVEDLEKEFMKKLKGKGLVGI